MKHILIMLTFLFVLASGCVTTGGAGIKSGDVYEGEGRGYRGPIRVLVRMDGGGITEIEVVESAEDRFVGGEAIDELLDLVIAYNTTDIDAVSGATESSKGFLEAVENAIMEK